jgi:hypothetical protein
MGQQPRKAYLDLQTGCGRLLLTPHNDRPCCWSTSKKDAPILRYAVALNMLSRKTLKLHGNVSISRQKC